MNITIPVKIVRAVAAKYAGDKDMIGTGIKDGWTHRSIIDKDSSWKDADTVELNLVRYSNKDLPLLYKQLMEFDVPDRTLDNIRRWMEVLKSPASAIVTSLPAMEKIFGELMKSLKDKWLFKEMPDGYFVPVVVTKYEHRPTRKDEAATFKISYTAGYYMNGKEEEDDIKEGKDNDSKYWYTYNLDDREASPELELEDLVDEDEDIDEDEDEPKKRKRKPRKTKIEGKTLAELLVKKNLHLPNEKFMEEYRAATNLYYQLSTKRGVQVTCNSGIGFDIRDSWSGKLRLEKVRLSEDNIPNRLVIDAVGYPASIVRTVDTTGMGTQALPYHPYIQCYDLTKHRDVAVHVLNLTEYQYNPKIADSLILPKEEKQLLQNVIAGKATYTDIISGKSGGMVILCSGLTGTGKTLTAEVSSEMVGKPLYQVQSAQLGLNIETIEKRLSAILRRAQKWDALLLIDECDTYVFERGDDMMQNAVVGTFLRLLEYYNGILFLTTNRASKIDGAIMSRVTAHIRYEAPTPENAQKILKTIAELFTIQVSDAEAKKIITALPGMTGRDIRNMLKLVKKYYHKESEKLVLKSEMIEPLKKFIPFLK